MRHLGTRLRVGSTVPVLLALASMAAITAMSSDTRAGTPPIYSINFHTISAGGGALRGNCFRLSGTVGQTAPGYSSGSIYSLIAGFWAPPIQASDEIFFNGFQGC